MDWHRLFGLLLADFCTGLPFEVEVEVDLSKRKQRLDIVLLRKHAGPCSERFPDGLDNLTTYNLITFKSHQEPLDAWALKELVGHYVNYRKQLSEPDQPLLPETEFRLYAVCARYPHNLANEVALEQVQDGVYDVRWGTDVIRLVVVRELPKEEHNAVMHLFGAARRDCRYGAENYRLRSPETSTVVQDLFARYREEGLSLPYTMKDFLHDFAKKYRDKLTDQERLEGMTPERILLGLSPEKIQALRERIEEAQGKQQGNEAGPRKVGKGYRRRKP